MAHLSSQARRAFALISIGAVALAFKKTKNILATAYLAEKAFKKLGNNSVSFLTLFPFYQILSDGGGDRGKSFRLDGERTKNKMKIKTFSNFYHFLSCKFFQYFLVVLSNCCMNRLQLFFYLLVLLKIN